MNLLKETELILKEYGKTLDDITFVQGAEFGISVDKFMELADAEYDLGCDPLPRVAKDLIVGGDGWWLERHYDGSEWWEYMSCKEILPVTSHKITALTVEQSTADISCCCETLARINGLHIEE